MWRNIWREKILRLNQSNLPVQPEPEMDPEPALKGRLRLQLRQKKGSSSSVFGSATLNGIIKYRYVNNCQNF